MFGSLAHHEFEDSQEASGLLRIKLLVLAHFGHFFLIVWLTQNFFNDLAKDESQFDCAHFVHERNLSEDPLGAIVVSTKIESHFYYNMF